jgi:hypothetical protein
LEFLNPINFAVLALPYGFGALLCRELAVRWKKGWLGLLLLALAYGIYEEGLVARSIWDPGWAELGAIGDYSFWRGVTWTWAAALLHFHVTVSIGASVALAHVLYPERRNQPWLTSRQLGWCGAGLALWAPALMLLHPFVPPAWALVAATLAVACLIVLARRLPNPPARSRTERNVAPIWYGLVAALDTTAVFVAVFMLPETAPEWLPPWPASLGFVVLVDGLAAWLILRWSGGGRSWDDRHKLALVSGVLAFFAAFDLAQDFEGDVRGGSLVAILAIAALAWLWRVTVRRQADRGDADAPHSA